MQKTIKRKTSRDLVVWGLKIPKQLREALHEIYNVDGIHAPEELREIITNYAKSKGKRVS